MIKATKFDLKGFRVYIAGPSETVAKPAAFMRATQVPQLYISLYDKAGCPARVWGK